VAAVPGVDLSPFSWYALRNAAVQAALSMVSACDKGQVMIRKRI